MNDSESADEDLERAERCYKLLLEAGSDLSVHKINDSPTNKQLESAFRRELRKGTLVRHSCCCSTLPKQLTMFRLR